MPDPLTELRQQEYDLRLEISRLTQALAAADQGAVQALLDALADQQAQLILVEQQRVTLQADNPQSGVLLDVRASAPAPVTRGGTTRGSATTGLVATVRLKMAHVPTAIYHLLNNNEHPLISGEVQNTSSKTRRIRVTSYIDGYTAHAIDTVEIEPGQTAIITQLPTLFPERIRGINELTRAMLNVLVEDLDGAVELHKTEPIWLLSRNSAPLYVRDPATDAWNDLTRYLGAFVTPNEPSIMQFLRKAAARHPQKQLFGYQADRAVEPQVRAIFDALKADADVTYVNSTINFNPEQSARTQRVRLPRQSLAEQQANCIDGVLLFASLLEAASLNPALVIIPGHALVAWETGKQSGQWHYLETTKLSEGTFDEACALGKQKAATFEALATKSNSPMSFMRWSLRDLRTKHGITPLE